MPCIGLAQKKYILILDSVVDYSTYIRMRRHGSISSGSVWTPQSQVHGEYVPMVKVNRHRRSGHMPCAMCGCVP